VEGGIHAVLAIRENGRERAYYANPVKRSHDMRKTIKKLRFFPRSSRR